MQIVDSKIVSGKRVLLRLDLDVALRLAPLAQGKPVVMEDYKIRAGIPTLNLCIQNASKVIILGHLGRPDGHVVEQLKVAPIVKWLKSQGYRDQIDNGQLTILENLRFDPREEAGDLGYAKELASMGDFYVNEAFSSYRPAVSTTILPTLMSHAAGLRFALEVEKLTQVRDNPKKPFIAIMGGAKVGDKLPVIEVLAQKADAVLVGGKLIAEIRKQELILPKNVMVGKLNEDGFDIAEETSSAWGNLISKAAMIVWNGPLGKFEDPENDQTKKVAKIVAESEAESIVGGGDTITALKDYLDKFSFISVGGGAMLKFLSEGTLPIIEVLT